MANGGTKQEENHKAWYLKSISSQSIPVRVSMLVWLDRPPWPMVDQSPLFSMPSILSAKSPTKAAVQCEDHRILCLEGNASATCRA